MIIKVCKHAMLSARGENSHFSDVQSFNKSIYAKQTWNTSYFIWPGHSIGKNFLPNTPDVFNLLSDSSVKIDRT